MVKNKFRNSPTKPCNSIFSRKINDKIIQFTKRPLVNTRQNSLCDSILPRKIYVKHHVEIILFDSKISTNSKFKGIEPMSFLPPIMAA